MVRVVYDASAALLAPELVRRGHRFDVDVQLRHSTPVPVLSAVVFFPNF